MTDDSIVDRIYEAAFVPDEWEVVLGSLADASGSAAGQMLIFRGIEPVQFKATDLTRPVASSITRDGWQASRRIQHYHAWPFHGFVLASEYFPDDVRMDASYTRMTAMGFDSQLGTIIPMPSGELAVFAFERWKELGRHEPRAIENLNRLYPHLARAGFIACRLGLERAQTAVSALEAWGIPAAALTRTGRMLAANRLLDSVSDTILPTAFGGLALASAPANRLFQDTIAQALAAGGDLVRSIPVPARDDCPALVVHVLPLVRSARDIMFGAEILVAATAVDPSSFVPSPNILMGLFDLTPAEMRLASSLAKGLSLKEAAQASGIRFSTARSYLESIFRKTGTNQQGQLVALLRSAQPLPTPRGG